MAKLKGRERDHRKRNGNLKVRQRRILSLKREKEKKSNLMKENESRNAKERKTSKNKG